MNIDYSIKELEGSALTSEELSGSLRSAYLSPFLVTNNPGGLVFWTTEMEKGAWLSEEETETFIFKLSFNLWVNTGCLQISSRTPTHTAHDVLLPKKEVTTDKVFYSKHLNNQGNANIPLIISTLSGRWRLFPNYCTLTITNNCSLEKGWFSLLFYCKSISKQANKVSLLEYLDLLWNGGTGNNNGWSFPLLLLSKKNGFLFVLSDPLSTLFVLLHTSGPWRL